MCPNTKCVIIVTGQWVHTKCLITEMGLGPLGKLTGQCYSVLRVCVRVVDCFDIVLFSTLKQTWSWPTFCGAFWIRKVHRSVSLLPYSWPVEHVCHPWKSTFHKFENWAPCLIFVFIYCLFLFGKFRKRMLLLGAYIYIYTEREREYLFWGLVFGRYCTRQSCVLCLFFERFRFNNTA